jgi:hypothetical protein
VASDEIREWLKDALPTPDVQQELMRQQVERLVLDGGTPREWYTPGRIRERGKSIVPAITANQVAMAAAHINRIPYSKLPYGGIAPPCSVWFEESSEKSSESLHRREEMNRAIAMQESSEKVPKVPASTAEQSFRTGMWCGFWVGIGAVLLTLAVLWYGVRR